ncbi:MAG TPA: acyltransferase [Steroidobacteraceae bacterium]|jgi:peptidoglycan/LPS O-acetylase OafA/YrhL|nr:acyltransferase [Steroidobacteraceae bacterium]
MSTARIPSLDGIRAVAVWLTIGHHIVGRFLPGSSSHWLEALGRGGDGVGVFFVLSGFLITKLLIEEKERTGTIDLGDFFLRRAFRILPPLYMYLIFAVLFAHAVGIELPPSSLIGASLFVGDYWPAESSFLTEHTWSLGVEEQFYLLWPPILIWSLARGGRALAAKVGGAIVLATPALRVAGYASGVDLLRHHGMHMFHARMDSLMCGCVVALCIGAPAFERCYRAYARVWWIGPLYTLLVSGLLTGLDQPLGATRLGTAYTMVIGLTVDSALTAMFILWASRNAHSLAGRFLNQPLMVRMGVLSYSAYLWQTALIHERNPTFLAAWPWMLLYIWIAAAASYYGVERHALSIRRRIERWRGSRKALLGAA